MKFLKKRTFLLIKALAEITRTQGLGVLSKRIERPQMMKGSRKKLTIMELKMLKKRKRNKMLDPNQPHLAASLKIRIPIKSLAMQSHYQNLQRIKKGNLRIC